MKEYFYYLRCPDTNKPIVTVCLIETRHSGWSRGVAICSEQDNPIKKKGKSIARGRAIKAIRCCTTEDRVLTTRGIDQLRKVTTAISPYKFSFKSAYRPPITMYESKIMGGLNDR